MVALAAFALDALPAAARLPAARELQVPLRALGDRAADAARAARCSGTTVNGARLWIHVGSLQFQPGELAKILLIVFLAGYLREKREVLAQGRLKDFGPLLADLGRRDARARRDERPRQRRSSTSGSSSAMLYVGDRPRALRRDRGRALRRRRGRRLQVVPHVRDRVTIWLHPWTDHAGLLRAQRQAALRQDCASYQLVKSLYSIAHGELRFGTGLGKGTFDDDRRAPADPVPEHRLHLLGARAGARAVGVAALLLVYMLFVARGFRIAMLAEDGFSKLLAVGLTFAFALQTFIIVGGVLRIIPLTGITLPFVSYGGSSVVANFVLLAGLLLVSNRANAERA